jgi:hypothetical protein
VDYEPLHVTFDARPQVVVARLDDVPRQIAAVASERGRRKLLVWLLAGWGTALVALDLVFGYSSHVFVVAGVAAWIAAAVAGIASLRRGLPGKVPEGCAVVRSVIHTLRDDVHPSRGMFGHLDFTGWEKPQKRAFERKTAAGAKVNVYRDEWLAIKTKLRDGTGLRLVAVRCVKRRAGFWKRGRRKSKWKSAVTKSDHQELRIRLVSGKPSEQLIARIDAASLVVGRQIGSYQVDACSIKSGTVDVSAHSQIYEPTAGDILEVLRFVHGLLPAQRA